MGFIAIFNETTESGTRVDVVRAIATRSGLHFLEEYVDCSAPELGDLLASDVFSSGEPYLLMVHQGDISFDAFRGALADAQKKTKRRPSEYPEAAFVIFYSGLGGDRLPKGLDPWFISNVKVLEYDFPTHEEGEVFEALVKAAKGILSDRPGECFADVDINAVETQQVIPTSLSALDILLQGYLAIRAPSTVFGGNAEVIQTINVRLHESEVGVLARTACGEGQRLIRSSFPLDGLGEEAEGMYWFDVCMPEVCTQAWADLGVGESHESLDDMLPLELVWNYLRGTCESLNDGIKKSDLEEYLARKYRADTLASRGDKYGLTETPPKHEDPLQRHWSCLFRDAHRQYLSLLFSDLDAIRGRLCHDRLSGLLWGGIGSGEFGMNNSPLSLRERYENLFTAIAHSCDESQAKGSSVSQINSVNKAGRDWQETAQDIRKFFDIEPAKFGLVLTGEGARCRHILLDKEDGVVPFVSRFFNSMQSLTELSPPQQEEAVRELDVAIGKLYKILHERMKDEGDWLTPFGGLLTYQGD